MMHAVECIPVIYKGCPISLCTLLLGATSALYRTTPIYNLCQKSAEPACYVKQPRRFGEFCKSMLTDPCEEINQEKFWSEKHFIETCYPASLSRTIALMPSIRNAFFCNCEANWHVVNHRSLGVHRGRIYVSVGSFVLQNIPHHTPLTVKHVFYRYPSPTEHKNQSLPVV